MKLPAMAGAATFAHLLGRGPKAAKAEGGDDNTDDERKKRDGESDDDYAKRMEELDDKEKQAEADEQKKKDDEAKKAESTGDDGKSGDENGDDEGDGADMRTAGPVRSARLRERARCAAIFAHPAAAKNPALAATLAFGTDLSRNAAVSVLQVGGLAVADPVAAAPQRQTLDQRMAAVKVPVVGASDPARPAAGAQTLAQQIIAAGKKARGET